MIMMHAENGIAIDVLVQQALARGETDPIYHGMTRPAELEAEATQPGDRAGQGRRRTARSTSCTCRASEALAAVAAGARRRAATCSPRPARSTST